MTKAWLNRVWQLGLVSSLSIGGAVALSEYVLAQVQPDSSLGGESSVVNPVDANSDRIDGGAIRDTNLFHSFQEFNVGEGRSVDFANPQAIENIFSRVTGNNPSQIRGVLGVFGDANLFLLNPNGIIFGENASLNVNGSFVATTAESILFENGQEFSAINPQKPILEIKVPLGLQIGNNPGAIVNQANLEVEPEKNIFLIGGDISLNGGRIIARGGGVEMGGLSTVGTVDINNDGSLNLPDGIARSDVFLTNQSFVDVAASNGGAIGINANNLQLVEGSQLRSGIASGLGSPEARGGNITINSTGEVTLNKRSSIISQVLENGIGNGGNINIQTSFLNLREGSIISASSFGKGDGGSVKISAADKITVNESLISSRVGDTAEGNAGDVDVSTKNMTIANGSINTSTLGKGNAGNIKVNATDNIVADGFGGIASVVVEIAEGNAGKIDVTTNNLTLTNRGQINNSTLNKGNAGDVNIITDKLTLTNEGKINTITYGRGNAGNINITAIKSLSADGGAIGSTVQDNAEGNSGEIVIDTEELTLNNFSQINNSVSGKGKGRDIKITANGTISIDNSSFITSEIIENAEGNAGEINITTNNLTLANGGEIVANTNGKGIGGNIKITANNALSVNNGNISSVVSRKGEGNGGNINIDAKKVSLLDNALLATSSLGKGDAGNIQINAAEKFTSDRSSVNSSILRGNISINGTVVNLSGEGDAGRLEIRSPQILLDNNAEILTNNEGKGNAGNIFLEANNLFSAANNSIISSSIGQTDGTPAEGKVGTITIAAEKVSLTNSSKLSAVFGSNTTGESGSISVKANDISFDGFESGIFTVVSSHAIANGSDIKLEANTISLANGARLSASNFGKGNGGSIKITAQDILSVDSSSIDSGLSSTAEGNAGEIDIEASKISFNNRSQLNTQSFGVGNAGNIKVNADSITLDRGSAIFASNNPSKNISSTLSGGDITMQITDRLTLRNNSDISTEASINANGGNIDITADAIVAFDDSDIFAFAQEGRGGNITLNTPAYFGYDFNPASAQIQPDFSNNLLDGNNRADINATGAISGVVTVPDVSFIQNSLTELPENPIDTNALIANSCIARRDRGGTFTVTGAGGLPNRPGNATVSPYPTGDVRGVESDRTSNNSTDRTWKIGDPIVEPQAAYRLADGQMVLSRECER